MNGLIIVNQTIGHNQYKIERFQEEFSKRNITLEVRENNEKASKLYQKFGFKQKC